MKNLILLVNLIFTLKYAYSTEACTSIPLAYSNISSCISGHCIITFSSTTTMDASPNSVACQKLVEVKLDNVTIKAEEDYFIEVSQNHCDYNIKFIGYGGSLVKNSFTTDVSIDPFNLDKNDCTGITDVYGAVQICILRYDSITTPLLLGLTETKTRRYAMKVGYDPYPRYQIFEPTKVVRHIELSIRDVFNNTNSTTQVSWDGKSLQSFDLFDSSDMALISQTGVACPAFENKFLIIDIARPFDIYLVDKSEVNTYGQSYGSKLFPFQWNSVGALNYNVDHIIASIVSKVYEVNLQHYPIVSSTYSYTGTNDELYFENKHLQKDSLKNKYFGVLFLDTIRSSVTVGIATKNIPFSHLSVNDQDPFDFMRSTAIKSIISYMSVMGPSGLPLYLIYGKTQADVTTCFIMDVLGVIDPTNNFPLKDCDNEDLVIYCNKTANKFHFATANSTVCIIDEHGGNTYLDVSKAMMTGDVTTPYFLSLRPESSSSLTYNLNTSREVTWVTNKCCPSISSIYDNLETSYLEINASSSCASGTAIIVETGPISDEPTSVALTSIVKTFFYRRFFNISGIQTISLCCLDNCVSKKFKVSYFPLVPEIPDVPIIDGDGGEAGDVSGTPVIGSNGSSGSTIADWFAEAWNKFNKWIKADFSSDLNWFLTVLKYIGVALMIIVGTLIILYIVRIVFPYIRMIFRMFWRMSRSMSKKMKEKHDMVMMDVDDRPRGPTMHRRTPHAADIEHMPFNTNF